MKHKSKNFLSSAADAYNSYKPKAQSKFSQVYDMDEVNRMAREVASRNSASKSNVRIFDSIRNEQLNKGANRFRNNDTLIGNTQNMNPKNLGKFSSTRSMLPNPGARAEAEKFKMIMMDSTKQKKHGGSIKNKK